MGVVIEFPRDVPATATRRGFVAGERYAVPDAATARRLYPEAVIVGYEDGRPYDGDAPPEPVPEPVAEPRRRRRG
jgi:hypothetical protein